MSKRHITGVVKLPGEEAVVMTDIENTLDGFQKLVKGYIETVTFEDCVVICNEEGRILRMAPNCKFRGVNFFGPIVVVDTDGEEFASLQIVNPESIAAELDDGSYE